MKIHEIQEIKNMLEMMVIFLKNIGFYSLVVGEIT